MVKYRQREGWSHREIVGALDAAFYNAFGAVHPSGKRTLLVLDVSGSMTMPISNMPLTCREASTTLALVTMATEPECEVVGFTGSGGDWREAPLLTELGISPRQRLDDAVRAVSDLPFGGTDCALPMVWAKESGKEFDSFAVLTEFAKS